MVDSLNIPFKAKYKLLDLHRFKMIEKINETKIEADGFLIRSGEELENFRLKFLSRKGIVSVLFDDFKMLEGKEKSAIGKPINELKKHVEGIYEAQKQVLTKKTEVKSTVDLSLPVDIYQAGGNHPIKLILDEIIEIFEKMGFNLAYGPECEDDWHNFGALNFAEDHPARDMQDTFFTKTNKVLRTHTSSVQVRIMENNKPPIRILSPGRVYRNEDISSRSNCFFHQVEGLYIDEQVSFADLKQVLYHFVSAFFGERKLRFRPSYFPFTEPSAEMDIWLGTETEDDKRLTKGTGWLEILGCGMVHPNVLKNNGIDEKKYSGFAFGMGVDRIAMIKYGIKDIRDMFSNDVNLLRQIH